MLTVWCLLEQDGMVVGVLASVSEKSLGGMCRDCQEHSTTTMDEGGEVRC